MNTSEQEAEEQPPSKTSELPPPYPTTFNLPPVEATSTLPPFIDFRLTYLTPTTQSLVLAVPSSSDLPYPSYTITLSNSLDIITPSILISTPDVRISHERYLADAFAEGRFHKYRNGIALTYPSTRLRSRQGDVNTTVATTLPVQKQAIKCDSLADRRYTFQLDHGGVLRDCCWRPPDSGPHHMLELISPPLLPPTHSNNQNNDDDDDEDLEVLALIFVHTWHSLPTSQAEQAVAVIRIREDLCDEPSAEGERGVMDQLLANAVVMVEKTRRRVAAMRAQVDVNSSYRGNVAKG